MRAILLIHFIIYFYDDTNSDVVINAIQAYSQGQCFLNVVDNAHTKDKLVSLGTDKEFDTTKNIWKNHVKTVENFNHNQFNKNVSNILLEQKIKSPLKQYIEHCYRGEITSDMQGQRTPCIDNIHDSTDRMAMVANI